MEAAVLLVDDDRRLIRSYAEALDGVGLRSHCCYGADDALAYLQKGAKPDIIVWDMMMPPGEAFANEDTEGGLSTGRFLYDKMREIHPDAVYILLTNDIHALAEYHKPELYSLSYAKVELTPDELCDLIRKLFEKIGVGSNASEV